MKHECEICAMPVRAVPGERTLCTEHLFSEELPALARLADLAREREVTV